MPAFEWPLEMRAEVVRRVLETNQPIRKIADEFGIHFNTPYRWAQDEPGYAEAIARRVKPKKSPPPPRRKGPLPTRNIDDALSQLWAEGHSSQEIGRRLGVSKNVVLGRIHRIGLPPRPSPIKPRSAPKEPKAPKAPRHMGTHTITGPTLPPLPSVDATSLLIKPPPQEPPMIVQSEAQIPLPLTRLRGGIGGTLVGPTLPQKPAVVVQFPAPVLSALYRSCQYITGERQPGGKWGFCDSRDMHPGSAYCREHHRVCWRPTRRQACGEAAD